MADSGVPDSDEVKGEKDVQEEDVKETKATGGVWGDGTNLTTKGRIVSSKLHPVIILGKYIFTLGEFLLVLEK